MRYAILIILFLLGQRGFSQSTYPIRTDTLRVYSGSATGPTLKLESLTPARTWYLYTNGDSSLVSGPVRFSSGAFFGAPVKGVAAQQLLHLVTLQQMIDSIAAHTGVITPSWQQTTDVGQSTTNMVSVTGWNGYDTAGAGLHMFFIPTDIAPASNGVAYLIAGASDPFGIIKSAFNIVGGSVTMSGTTDLAFSSPGFTLETNHNGVPGEIWMRSSGPDGSMLIATDGGATNGRISIQGQKETSIWSDSALTLNTQGKPVEFINRGPGGGLIRAQGNRGQEDIDFITKAQLDSLAGVEPAIPGLPAVTGVDNTSSYAIRLKDAGGMVPPLTDEMILFHSISTGESGLFAYNPSAVEKGKVLFNDGQAIFSSNGTIDINALTTATISGVDLIVTTINPPTITSDGVTLQRIKIANGQADEDAVTKLQLDSAGSSYVHLTGDEVINGVKSFNDNTLLNGTVTLSNVGALATAATVFLTVNGSNVVNSRTAAEVRSDIGANNASNLTTGTVGTARMGTGTANANAFLRGDGTWSNTLNGNYVAGGTFISSVSGVQSFQGVTGGTVGSTGTLTNHAFQFYSNNSFRGELTSNGLWKFGPTFTGDGTTRVQINGNASGNAAIAGNHFVTRDQVSDTITNRINGIAGDFIPLNLTAHTDVTGNGDSLRFNNTKVKISGSPAGVYVLNIDGSMMQTVNGGPFGISTVLETSDVAGFSSNNTLADGSYSSVLSTGSYTTIGAGNSGAGTEFLLQIIPTQLKISIPGSDKVIVNSGLQDIVLPDYADSDGDKGLATDATGKVILKTQVLSGVDPTTHSTDFTASGYSTYRVDNSGGTVTVGLPTASLFPGKIMMFKVSGSSVNAVTIGGNSVVLGAPAPMDKPLCIIQSDGSSWVFLQGF